MTDKELEGKFSSLQDGMKSLETLMKTILENQAKEILRNERKIELLDERININDSKTLTVETKLDNHIDSHSSKDTAERFNLEMWVLIGLFAVDKIGSWISHYLPAP